VTGLPFASVILNFSGIVCPALAMLSTPLLSTGEVNSVQLSKVDVKEFGVAFWQAKNIAMLASR
jgi:hypothetical protein